MSNVFSNIYLLLLQEAFGLQPDSDELLSIGRQINKLHKRHKELTSGKSIPSSSYREIAHLESALDKAKRSYGQQRKVVIKRLSRSKKTGGTRHRLKVQTDPIQKDKLTQQEWLRQFTTQPLPKEDASRKGGGAYVHSERVRKSNPRSKHTRSPIGKRDKGIK